MHGNACVTQILFESGVVRAWRAPCTGVHALAGQVVQNEQALIVARRCVYSARDLPLVL